jgi:hypothetical protein
MRKGECKKANKKFYKDITDNLPNPILFFKEIGYVNFTIKNTLSTDGFTSKF